jgi:hypothetical protein
MGRTVAVIWHASFSLVAAGLYFFFVLPRWPELMGQTSPTLGLVLRIVTALLIGLSALPVVFTLLRTRKPQYGTPELALRLRTASIVLHVLAALLILGAALSEIWLSLDVAGQWQFGVYGAAAAIALLGIFGFYLAFLAEVQPPAPKPVKRREKKVRSRLQPIDSAADEVEAVEADESESDESESEAEDESESDADEAEGSEGTADSARTDEAADDADEATTATEAAEKAPRGKLRNRRPGRRSGGVAVKD